jgi:DNA polymerase
MKLGQHLACHREAERWNLLYRLLWRLTHGEPVLLDISTDDDVYLARTWAKQVRRDAHKMKAFVRFRRCSRDDEEWFVAWHRSDHRVARLVAPFFVDRFSSMRWTILTPDESLCWDLHKLQFGPGSNRLSAPDRDELEEMWKSYYVSTFNPARIKLKAMQAEMPRRYWSTLPETETIETMLAEAPKRVADMARHRENWPASAAEFLPEQHDLESLRSAAQHCQGCPLHSGATQTVFGEGPPNARLVLVGEQPGNEEDRVGRPFVGSAGRVLNGVLREVGIERRWVYMTNAVKHFKYVESGKRRLHKKPNRIEVVSCRAWLEQELDALAPQVVVCLGTTAAASLISPSWQVSKQRGHVVETPWCAQTLATYHPSAILRSKDERCAHTKRKAMVEDLHLARSLLS